MQRRVQKGFEVFEYYANNQWDFDNANVLHLRSLVNDIEKEKYAIQDDGMCLRFEKCSNGYNLSNVITFRHRLVQIL